MIGTVPHRPSAQAVAALRQASATGLMCRLPPLAASRRHDTPPARGARATTPAPPYTEHQDPSDVPPSYRECMDADAAVDLVEDGDFSETSSLYGDTR